MSLPDTLGRADERVNTLATERDTLEREMEAALAAKEEELTDAVRTLEGLIVEAVQEVGIASVLDPAHDELATLLLTSDVRIGAFALRDMFREAGLGMGSISTQLIIPFPAKKEDSLSTAAAFIATIMRLRAAKGGMELFAFSVQTEFDPEFPERGWLHRFVLHATESGFLLHSTKGPEVSPVSTIHGALARIEEMMGEQAAPVRNKEEFAPRQVSHAASAHDIQAARAARKSQHP